MKRFLPAAALAAAALGAWSAGPQVVQTQSRVQSIRPSTPDGVLDWSNSIDRMIRTKELRVRADVSDPLVPGRRIERVEQLHDGVRIWGADAVRQLDSAHAVSVFGTLYADPAIATTPLIGADEAKGVIEAAFGNALGPDRLPELAILPTDDGYRLVWIGSIAHVDGATRLFIDARTGREVRREDAFERQAANAFVGHGRGVLGDDKKLSIFQSSAGFVLFDTLRPPDISTFDLRGNLARTINFLNGIIPLNQVDYGSSGSNDFTDAALVDAHAYSSQTYDYFFKRFGRRGLDNADRRLWNLVHTVRRSDIFGANADVLNFFYLNAVYFNDVNVMMFGEGLPGGLILSGSGQYVDYFSGAIDIVAHELTHGVTRYSSNLQYQGEAGALNESFSDMMGTSVEFYFHPAGDGQMRADYLIGEDIVRAARAGSRSGLRSMADPQLYDDPDHYSRRYTGAEDNGGVHINSGIPNHAFYLAIEGGTNRTSGIRVQGVGAANREQIEKVFYRAFTQLLPSGANFSMARAASLQAAIDLYGLNSGPYAAVRDAWTAVGVN